MTTENPNDFPRGKISADDEGALNIIIGTKDKTIIIQFGKPVSWIGMDKETAMTIGKSLIEKASAV